MISKQDLAKYIPLTGFKLGQMEIDYLQHMFLFFLSKHTAIEFIFKGGTALQKDYGLPRFSIDLDFTQQGKDECTELMKWIAQQMSEFGYPTSFKEIKALGKTFVFRIAGPLKGDSDLSLASLRIKISQRENVLLKPKLIEIKPLYHDLQPYTFIVMQEEEILAEKIRAIMSRNKSRDIFDLHFLLNRGVEMDTLLVEKKLSYYEEKFDLEKIYKKIKLMEPLWEKELKNYLAEVPPFEKVYKEINEKLAIVKK